MANGRKRIAVAGATGRVGSHVVDLLETAGHEVVAISRSHGVDVITGNGLAQALEGTVCIVDAATGPSSEQGSATEFFTTAARNLQEAGEQAGVRRMVAVSIIGCDRFSAGYNVAKVAHERTILEGPIPTHILRAAQFHEFVGQLVEWGNRGEVSYVPKMRTQLVAARTVAGALADLATNHESQTRAAAPLEIAGPRTESLAEAARLLVAQRGDQLRIEETSDPADPDRELFAGNGLLPGPDAILAGPTFEDWLESAPAIRPA
jgi:uncharacterized protein YbjT (DUF2867 family)